MLVQFSERQEMCAPPSRRDVFKRNTMSLALFLKRFGNSGNHEQQWRANPVLPVEIRSKVPISFFSVKAKSGLLLVSDC